MSTITINVLSSVSTGPTSGYFILPGDFTTIFYPGYQFTFKGIGLLNITYTTTSSSLVAGNTQVVVSQAVVGTIVAISAATPGTGTYIAGPIATVGTYNNVPLSGEHGTGATATVVVSGPGPINTFSTFTGGSGYTQGAYVIPLVGQTGTGTGAMAQVVVYPGGVVGSVSITAAGTGYNVNDILVASTGTIPGGGSGFNVVVGTVLGTLTSATLLDPGVAYQVNDLLSFGGFGFGLNNSVTVLSVTTTEVGTITLLSTNPKFKYGQNVFCIVETAGVWGSSGSSTQFIGVWPWFDAFDWDWLNPIGPFVISPAMQVPAVQSGQILQVLVTTTDSIQTPKVTYQIRLQGQTGVTQLDESMVFTDKATAITAYSAIVM